MICIDARDVRFQPSEDYPLDLLARTSELLITIPCLEVEFSPARACDLAQIDHLGLLAHLAL